MRRRDGTHHDHSLETQTDASVRRLFASVGDKCATIGWDYPGKTLLEVRIVRSTRGAAAGPEDVGDGRAPGSARAARCGLVYQGVTGSFRDAGLDNGRAYVYSVFARHPGGEWVRWGDLELTPVAQVARPDEPGVAHSRRHDASAANAHPDDAGAVTACVAGLGALALVVVLAVLLALGAASRALAQDGASAEGQGNGAEAEASDVSAAVWDAAVTDPLVVDLMAGRQPATSAADVRFWPAESEPSGATVYLLWPDGPGVEIDAELPVVRRRDPDEPPAEPYEVIQHRVRATDVTGLRVLVSLQDESVLEVYPYDEHAEYLLHEDTTPPFSWVPWFTAHAWVLLPVFAAAALYLGIRAWLRSRAWRRRLPSMSRHDRQFVGRMTVAALLLVAIVVMGAAIWRAVAAPILDPDRMVGDDLATWPLIVFPPLLYAAALGLELAGSSHRVAWWLVAVVAGVSCVYTLVAMEQATVTDLTLLYYILLGCLTLVAIPRAFAPGKLGWSRSQGRAGSSV